MAAEDYIDLSDFSNNVSFPPKKFQCIDNDSIDKKCILLDITVKLHYFTNPNLLYQIVTSSFSNRYTTKKNLAYSINEDTEYIISFALSDHNNFGLEFLSHEIVEFDFHFLNETNENSLFPNYYSPIKTIS